MKKKVLILFFLFIIIFCGNNYAKYVIEYTSVIADIKIDRVKPKFEMVQALTENEERVYTNGKQEITINVKEIESNLKTDNFNKENVKILVNNNEIIPEEYEIQYKEKVENTINYELKLSGIEENGTLKIKVLEGTTIDIAGNMNEETILDPYIIIDNTTPVTVVKTKQTEDGDIQNSTKVEVNITKATNI